MIKNSHHLSWKFLVVVLFFLQCNGKTSEQTAADSRPNIIFIMADDLGYADLGCYGQKRIATPHIDRLASEGLKFTQVYAGSTVCAPSRSVLMTGQHLGHTTVRGNSSALLQSASNPQGRVPLADSDITVAEVLKGAGYVTGITGKWGLGEPGTEGIPNKQGFDEWFGYLNQKKAHSYYPEYLWKNEEKVILGGNANSEKQVYSHDLMTDFALDFIAKHQDTTFCEAMLNEPDDVARVVVQGAKALVDGGPGGEPKSPSWWCCNGQTLHSAEQVLNAPDG